MLGILMLQTQFPRLPGDVGHAASWRMPVRMAVVTGATPRRVVQEADPQLMRPFIDAGRQLVSEGATALTTSCGFLARWQDELQAALGVPLWTSSLLLLARWPAAAVLTVDAASLDAELIRRCGGGPQTPVQGLEPGCHLQTTLLEDLPTMDVQQAQRDAVSAARQLVERHPAVERLILECTNLPPYEQAIQRATGRPVHHLMTLVHEQWELLS